MRARSSTLIEEKARSFDTCSRYDVTLLGTFHLKVGVVETPTAPVAGEAGVGGSGSQGQSNPIVVTTAMLSMRKTRFMMFSFGWFVV